MYRLVLLLSATSLAFAEAAGPGAPVAPDAPAGAPAGAGAQGAASMLPSILLMGGIFAFMWFVLIRPQRKEEARRKELLASLKRGDEVTTIGGVHGVVETVGEQTIDVRIGTGDKTLVVTFNKGAVNANLATEKAAADAAATGKK